MNLRPIPVTAGFLADEEGAVYSQQDRSSKDVEIRLMVFGSAESYADDG